jgi:peptidoglycan/xylan/chitin deacetylase (PgdA/CDA1 family)
VGQRAPYPSRPSNVNESCIAAHPPAVRSSGGTIYRRLPDASGRCYLTFDDGPDLTWTPRVLETLALAGVRATFFALGKFAGAGASLLREAHDAGHTIGSHGYSHRHPWTLSPRRAHAEVRDGTDAIAQVLGTRPEWFRPSHGRLGLFLDEAVRDAGQRIALWSVSAVDWGPLATPHGIYKRLRVIRTGDIVLMHDGPLRHNRPDIMLRILPALLAALASHGPTPAALPALATMHG